MKKLIIAEGEKTPEVILDPENKLFRVKGRSYPEYADEFYKPVYDWFDDNLPLLQECAFHFDLYYLNSASLVSVKTLLLKLKKQADSGKMFEIFWHYDPDDNDILRTGEDYTKLTGVKLQFVQNEEE